MPKLPFSSPPPAIYFISGGFAETVLESARYLLHFFILDLQVADQLRLIPGLLVIQSKLSHIIIPQPEEQPTLR